MDIRLVGKPQSGAIDGGATINDSTSDWMPSTDELVTMVAHEFNISKSHYLVTRSRPQFMGDAMAVLRRQLMPVNLITNMARRHGTVRDK